jgi:CheY-like chemotaxis protein
MSLEIIIAALTIFFSVVAFFSSIAFVIRSRKQPDLSSLFRRVSARTLEAMRSLSPDAPDSLLSLDNSGSVLLWEKASDYPPSPKEKKPNRILLVDDNETARKLIVQQLERLGYDILESSTSSEAVDVLKKNRGKIQAIIADVVIFDIGLPAIQSLREIDPSVPIIAFLETQGSEQNKIFPSKRFVENLKRTLEHLQ